MKRHLQSLEMIDQQHQALYERFLVTSDPREKPFLLRRLANLCRVRNFLLENRQQIAPFSRTTAPHNYETGC